MTNIARRFVYDLERTNGQSQDEMKKRVLETLKSFKQWPPYLGASTTGDCRTIIHKLSQ